MRRWPTAKEPSRRQQQHLSLAWQRSMLEPCRQSPHLCAIKVRWWGDRLALVACMHGSPARRTRNRGHSRVITMLQRCRRWWRWPQTSDGCVRATLLEEHVHELGHINLGFGSDSAPRLGTAARIGWSTHPVKTPGGPPKRDPRELQRKGGELQPFASRKFEVQKFDMRNFGRSQDRNLHASTWSRELSRAEVERWLMQTFVQELWQFKVVGKLLLAAHSKGSCPVSSNWSA